MVEQWIPARKAFEIIQDQRALEERLKTGLQRAKAELLMSESQTLSNADIPSGFWQHDVYYDPRFDWNSGDFVGRIDGAEEVNAMGVKLALTGVLEMVAFERRGLLARSLSVAGSKEWLTALEAKRLVYGDTTRNYHIAGDIIVEQARLGFIVAKAVLAQCQQQGDTAEWTWQEREWDIPAWFWSNFIEKATGAHDWTLGQFSGVGIAFKGICSIALSDVHFHRESVEAFLGVTETVEQSEPSETRRGRRPTYECWR